MHKIGKFMEVCAYNPNSANDTIKLISDKWDFHWQGFYTYPKIKFVPAGTIVRGEATYDNTTSNPENPSSPPQLVYAGENTTDEMMIVTFVFAAYMPGDENIIIDSAVALSTQHQFTNYYHGQQLLDVHPNPAINDIIVKCYLDEADKGSIDLIDMQGKVVKRYMENEQISKGYNAFIYSIAGLPAGNYTIRMQTSQRVLSQLIMVH